MELVWTRQQRRFLSQNPASQNFSIEMTGLVFGMVRTGWVGAQSAPTQLSFPHFDHRLPVISNAVRNL